MSSIAAQTYLTPEEYIASERKATLKNEYLSGEFSALEDVLPLASIEAELSLNQIYRFVELETDNTLQATRTV